MFSSADSLCDVTINLLASARGKKFGTILADPPWQFQNRTGKVAPEHRRLSRYGTMALDEICALPVGDMTTDDAVLFLWATNPKLAESMRVVESWGFTYRTCAVWTKDQIGMGYYFRQRHELLLVAVKGSPPMPAPADRPDSVIVAPRQEHSAKPVIVYGLIERMYPSLPKIELFARLPREGWARWGNQAA